MYNLRLIGGRLDHFNIRVSFAVIGIFTIITIVSYFYELSRAGLLSRHAHYHPRFPHLHRETREAGEPAPGSRHPLHQLGFQIDSIKDKFRLRGKDDTQVINIAVHLGKNDSYAKVNATFSAYQHQNTHSNFYTKSCLAEEGASPGGCVQNLTAKAIRYNNATQVLVYQHEPAGYFMRDCFKFAAENGGKNVADVPLNSARREEWDHLGIAKKKSSVPMLYGGLAFGVCESVSRPCLYMTLVSHPLTRILALYNVCSEDRNKTYCKINGLHHNNITLDTFIRAQGNNLFHRLLYNHRHCKLVGEDEICLPDSGASFVLSRNEKKAYLDDIVDNLEQWFGLVGLVNYLPESLKMFESAVGLKFGKCMAQSEYVNKQYKKYIPPQKDEEDYYDDVQRNEYTSLKEDLEKDSEVQRILHADLVIYAKLEEIFKRQLKAYGLYEYFVVAKRTQERNREIEEQAIAERHLSRKMAEYTDVTRNISTVTNSSSGLLEAASENNNLTKDSFAGKEVLNEQNLKFTPLNSVIKRDKLKTTIEELGYRMVSTRTETTVSETSNTPEWADEENHLTSPEER